MIKEATINLEEEIKQLIGYLIDLKNEYKNTEVAIAQADESIALIEKKFY